MEASLVSSNCHVLSADQDNWAFQQDPSLHPGTRRQAGDGHVYQTVAGKQQTVLFNATCCIDLNLTAKSSNVSLYKYISSSTSPPWQPLSWARDSPPSPPLVLHVAFSVLTCFIQIGQQLITRCNNRKVNKNAHERRGTWFTAQQLVLGHFSKRSFSAGSKFQHCN